MEFEHDMGEWISIRDGNSDLPIFSIFNQRNYDLFASPDIDISIMYVSEANIENECFVISTSHTRECLWAYQEIIQDKNKLEIYH